MLDRFKLFQELDRVREQILINSNEYLRDLELLWQRICADESVVLKIMSKKWPLLVPFWNGSIGEVVSIEAKNHPYQVLAVDGSQIYYDKHQGPACSLINIGAVFLNYGTQESKVELYSYPEVIVASGDTINFMNTEYINLYREQCELTEAVKKSCQYIQSSKESFLCMLDGSLIFFQCDGESKSYSNEFFAYYMQQLQILFESKILHAAYMSFPKTKDLVNLMRIFSVDYQEKKIQETDYLAKFSDMDILKLFLPQGYRTIIFESKAPICYMYPKHLKPYFCYLNVGFGIIRLEFAQWIAQDVVLVNQICSIALDQAKKGHGYPVALFEAHEHAVIKSPDRDFFYETIKQMYIKNNQKYIISAKSSKKIQPIV